MHVLFLLPPSLFNFSVSSCRLMLSSFEPFLFYIETAPYGELERIQRQTSTPVDTFASHPLQLRESTPLKSWKELQRVQGRGESSEGGGGTIKEERFTTLVWNSYALRTYHCLRSEGFKEPLSFSLFALSFSLTTSPVLVLSIQPFLSFSYTLLVNSLTAGKDKGSDGANKRYPALS